jgi:hypothetical protein
MLNLTTLPPSALPGYDACLRDVLALLDRVAPQPAIAHVPTLRLVLEDRAALLPGLGARISAETAQDGLADAVADALAAAVHVVPAPADADALERKRERQREWARAKKERGGALRPPGGVVTKWTDERIALAREKGGTMPGMALLAALNALPGPPIASTGSMRHKLKDLGIEVTPGLPPLPPGADVRDPDEETRAIISERGRLLQVAAGAGDWTEARLAMLRAEFATADSTECLLERINALPGNPIASVESMRHKASSLGMTRPRGGADPAHMAKMNAARSAAAAVRRGEVVAPEPATIKPDLKVASPEPPEPPTIKPRLTVAPEPPPRPVVSAEDDWTADGQLTAEAERDAAEQFAAGVGARALQQDFGGTMEFWQAWCASRRGRAA